MLVRFIKGLFGKKKLSKKERLLLDTITIIE